MNHLSIACINCQANNAAGGSDAIGWSIFFLLIVILLVASFVTFFMVRLALRARKYALIEEAEMQNELQRATTL